MAGEQHRSRQNEETRPDDKTEQNEEEREEDERGWTAERTRSEEGRKEGSRGREDEEGTTGSPERKADSAESAAVVGLLNTGEYGILPGNGWGWAELRDRYRPGTYADRFQFEATQASLGHRTCLLCLGLSLVLSLLSCSRSISPEYQLTITAC